MALGLDRKLSVEWEKMESFPHVIIALSLLRPETVDNAYWGFLAMYISGCEPDFKITAEEHDGIMRERMTRKAEEQKKFDKEWEKYMEEIRRLSANVSDVSMTGLPGLYNWRR